MPTITYKNQPGTARDLKKRIPMSGVSSPYTVTKVLWPKQLSYWIQARLIPPTLHICSGKSLLGDYRLDLHENSADIKADAARLPFRDQSWTTVLIDPPYNGIFRWMHDMLTELARVARHRIIFQHWFLPIDRKGLFKKSHQFTLTEIAIWQPSTYFGRVNVLTIMDRTKPNTEVVA